MNSTGGAPQGGVTEPDDACDAIICQTASQK
jgi:hypothetical protein